MAAGLSPEEQAVNDATPAWRALPSTAARRAELAAIAAAPEVRALSDADAITALLQAFIVLDKANPIPDVLAALDRGLV